MQFKIKQLLLNIRRNNCALLLIHVQAKGSVAAEEQASKANARAVELEKQVWTIEIHEHLARTNGVLVISRFIFLLF